MKKAFKRSVCALLAAASMTTIASAAGYSVVLEPCFNAIDGEFTDVIGQDNDIFSGDTGFYPTPFYKGHSVVHHNVRVMPGEGAEYYAKASTVVDIYGNKLNLGDYDSYGGYSFDIGSGGPEVPRVEESTGLDEEEYEYSLYYGGYFSGYKNPSFDLSEGVNKYGYIIVEKDGKGGLIDVSGNVILPCQYDEFSVDGENRFTVTNIVGDEVITKCIDKNGNEIESEFIQEPYIDNSYSGKYNKTPYFNIGDTMVGYHYFGDSNAFSINSYHNDLIVVSETKNEQGKVGIVDRNDNIVVPFIYDMITPYYEDYCWVLKDGLWGVIYVDNKNVTVKVNDAEVAFDQKPMIINGRTLVPLRAIFEALNADVLWDGATSTVTAKKDNTEISLTIGSNQLYVNGIAKEIDVPAMIVSERTIVPARAISEAFNCQVNWEAQSQTITVIE